ncbi:MAG: hypothetical protein ABSA29_21195 [Terriglobales bacterium]
MKLLTDGTGNNPLLGFCLAVISRHSENWPPTEQVLAKEFVSWLGVKSFLTRDVMQELCLSKGINLSFVALAPELRGFNCSFQDRKEIVISEHENVPFADLHTLLHEFREMLEHVFVELGWASLTPKDSLEETAEEFAAIARMETVTREFPVYIKMVSKIETPWQRYLGYAVLVIGCFAYIFTCVTLPQYEDMIADARRQRYVRT